MEHIVFDIGKVLIHYDPHLGFMELIPDADARAEFFATVCTPDWNIEQDRGRSWEEAEALLIGQHPDSRSIWSAASGATGTRWCRMPMTTASPSLKALWRRATTSPC